MYWGGDNGPDWRGSGSMVHPVYNSGEADLLRFVHLWASTRACYLGWILMSNKSSQDS